MEGREKQTDCNTRQCRPSSLHSSMCAHAEQLDQQLLCSPKHATPHTYSTSDVIRTLQNALLYSLLAASVRSSIAVLQKRTAVARFLLQQHHGLLAEETASRTPVVCPHEASRTNTCLRYQCTALPLDNWKTDWTGFVLRILHDWKREPFISGTGVERGD